VGDGSLRWKEQKRCHRVKAVGTDCRALGASRCAESMTGRAQGPSQVHSTGRRRPTTDSGRRSTKSAQLASAGLRRRCIGRRYCVASAERSPASGSSDVAEPSAAALQSPASEPSSQQEAFLSLVKRMADMSLLFISLDEVRDLINDARRALLLERTSR
jgi:hypothetical protein